MDSYLDLPTLFDPIPVTFEWGGKAYTGKLQLPKGGAGLYWDLLIDDKYHGCLINRGQFGWTFDSPKGNFEDMADHFRDLVLAWYQ